jgi:GT2 family glycosyltransferase
VDHGPARRRSGDGAEECRWVGGNVAIRRDAVARVGRYDVRLTRGQDTEYYWRCIERGLTICYEPAALVYHTVGPERLTPAYLRWWSHRTGHFRAYRLPWKWHHLLTIVPLWWYGPAAKALLAWLTAALTGRSWEERFRAELTVREFAGTWLHRLQLVPKAVAAMLSRRSVVS